MSGTAAAWCASASGEGWQVAGIRSCGQHSPGELASHMGEELDVVPETETESQLCDVGREMDGFLLPGSASSATVPAFSRGITEQAAFSVPSCMGAQEGVGAALTAELQTPSLGWEPNTGQPPAPRAPGWKC